MSFTEAVLNKFLCELCIFSHWLVEHTLKCKNRKPYFKRNLDMKETCIQRETFTFQRIWSPENPKCKYLHETVPACLPACNGK
jgi:hypothetical protein